MRFEILGPLSVRTETAPVAVRARREQVVIAALLLQFDETVSVERLVDAVWDGHPPRDARNQVQGCISRLRRRFAAAGASGPEIILTNPAGYRLAADQADLDLSDFRRLRDRARADAAAGDHERAAGQFRAALGLWRGPALAGIESPLVRRSATSLDEERVHALTACLEIELTMGRAATLVPELTELAREHPYQEKLHAALMLALYQTGRPADALAAYQHARKVLHDELGTEPGGELAQLHRAILTHDPSLAGRPAEPVALPSAVPIPRELPADVAGFTGRLGELKALDELLPGLGPAPVVISAIAGTAGVGKTAFAVHWAHRVAERFPDGQLYLNLRGYAAGAPLRPIDALAALLRSLGTAPEQIPTEMAAAVARYRSQLAGRQVLLVLDNAGSAEQVRPLLPGTAGCLALVTSRDRLAGLVARDGARRVTLDVLPADEAQMLLARLVGADRTDTERDATAALARVCACLPLALRIAAANLIDRPRQTVAGYLAELTSSDRLSQLEAYGDQETALRATFDHSYRRLATEAQRMFRLLGLVPGPEFTADAAAALAAIQLSTATRLLFTLAGAHLIQETAPNRFALHDLLRLYARERVDQEENEPTRREAMQRLLRWYASGAMAAADLRYPEMIRLPTPPELAVGREPRPAFDGPGEALAWLDSERANLVAAIRSTADSSKLRAFAWHLTSSLYGYFWHQRHTGDWEVAVAAALPAAEHARELAAQAAMRWSAGGAHRASGRTAEATADLASGAELARLAGWGEGEAFALANLGTVHVVNGQFELARRSLSRALLLARQSGQRVIEARVLGSLGYLSKQTGRLREAADYCGQQLSINQNLYPADSPEVARSLSNLASVEHELGYLAAADEKLTTALALHRQAGRRLGELNALIVLVVVRTDTGELDSAHELAQTALALARQLGDPRKEGEAYDELGSVHRNSGRPREAIRCHQRALATARLNGDPSLQFTTLHGLAWDRCELAQYEQAAEHATEAWEIASRMRYRIYQGLAMTVLARVRHGQGRVDEAQELANRAVEALHAAGYRLGESRARAVLGSILQATGEADGAAGQRDAARRLLQDIGAPVPDDLAAG